MCSKKAYTTGAKASESERAEPSRAEEKVEKESDVREEGEYWGEVV